MATSPGPDRPLRARRRKGRPAQVPYYIECPSASARRRL